MFSKYCGFKKNTEADDEPEIIHSKEAFYCQARICTINGLYIRPWHVSIPFITQVRRQGSETDKADYRKQQVLKLLQKYYHGSFVNFSQRFR